MRADEALARPGLSARLHPLLAMFLISYMACAAFFQSRGTVPMWSDMAPIEFFTSSLLWVLSFVCLLTSTKHEWFTGRFLFWAVSSAGLALLAMDERFAQHERTAELVGDDDYFKIAAWIAAGVALYVVCRLERPRRSLMIILGVGYALHLMYLLVDLGDGEIFRIPYFETTTLRRSEEVFELLFLSSYLFAFVAFLPLTGPERRQQKPPDLALTSRIAEPPLRQLDHEQRSPLESAARSAG